MLRYICPGWQVPPRWDESHRYAQNELFRTSHCRLCRSSGHVDHGELGVGGGIICGVLIDDIVHLLQFLAGEREAQEEESKVCRLEITE